MAITPLFRPKPFAALLATSSLSLYLFKSHFLTTNAHAESPNSVEPKPVFSGRFGSSLKLQSAETVNHNTKRLRFEFPDERQRSGLVLASAVLIIAWPQGRLFPVLRPYTPITSIDERGHLDLLVKHYPSGAASSYLHSLIPGTSSLYFLTSIPHYKWIPNSFHHITLIAGGAGITPMYQLIQGILSNPEDKTAITLVFGVNSEKDVLLKREFEGFERSFPGRFRVVYTVSRLEEGGGRYRKGYVTRDLLEEVVGVEKRGKGGKEKIFVCGPPAMEDALLGKKGGVGPFAGRKGGILEELGYGKEQVHQF